MCANCDELQDEYVNYHVRFMALFHILYGRAEKIFASSLMNIYIGLTLLLSAGPMLTKYYL